MAAAALLQQTGSHVAKARLVVDGQQWAVGDFTVRVGSVSGTSDYRGTLVQVPPPTLDEGPLPSLPTLSQ